MIYQNEINKIHKLLTKNSKEVCSTDQFQPNDFLLVIINNLYPRFLGEGKNAFFDLFPCQLLVSSNWAQNLLNFIIFNCNLQICVYDICLLIIFWCSRSALYSKFWCMMIYNISLAWRCFKVFLSSRCF